jgi:Protein of unknown function (DUF3037)
MRLPYSYVLLRYVHDVVRGEFANVGVVLFAPDSHFLRGRFVSDFRRLRAMFGELDEAHLSAMAQHLDETFAKFHPGRDAPKRDISQLVQQVLPADDSSLQWSPAGGGVTNDATDKLNHLFQRFVQQHCEPVTALPQR